MHKLITTLGLKTADELGLILPHEHVFVDLRTWDQPGYGEADMDEVVEVMTPEIEKAKASGVTAIVECTTGGVGRRADIDKAVSEATGFPLVMATGIYREPWVPDWAHKASEEALRDWMIGELTGEIEDSGVQAAWIKLSASDDGITEVETKILRAAAQAGAATNAVIGSHTVKGRVVRDQLDIIEDAGYTPERYIWIHTQNEPDLDLHVEMARRGAWVEYDAIGRRDDADNIRLIRHMLDAGFQEQVLLSHDLGWYDPAQPRGGDQRPYTYLSQEFLPRLEAAGVDRATIRQLTHDNPFRAFARPAEPHG